MAFGNAKKLPPHPATLERRPERPAPHQVQRCRYRLVAQRMEGQRDGADDVRGPSDLYIGFRREDLVAWLERQSSEKTCWAATFAYCATLLLDQFVGEGQILKMAEDLQLTHWIRNGAPPNQYQELINVLKERTGVCAREIAFSYAEVFLHLEARKPVIVSVGRRNDHVVLVFALESRPGTEAVVHLYDTGDGEFKSPGLSAFMRAANRAFLMDRYKKQ